MKRTILAILSVFSVISIWFFVSEGKRQTQSLNPLFRVGGKTIRDLTSVSTALISNPPPEFERSLGQKIVKKIANHGALMPENSLTVRRIRDIGERLLIFTETKGFLYSSKGEKMKKTPFKYQFFVVDLPFFNAFALPGGFVLVTKRAVELVRNDSELAWIIAHELIHLEKKHYLEQLRLAYLKAKSKYNKIKNPLISIASLIHSFLQLSYSEEFELEADSKAIELLKKADFKPNAAIDLMVRLFPASTRPAREQRNPFYIPPKLLITGLKEYFATHPHWRIRMKKIKSKLKKKD